MRIKDLYRHWAEPGQAAAPVQQLALELDAHTKARLDALAALFPGQSPEKLIQDLLRAAVDEFEGSLPYVPGDKVIEHDEMGDPIHEDVGHTPRFQALVRRNLRALTGGE